MLSINEILKSTKGKIAFRSKVKEITGYAIDSRAIKKGSAFIAVKGSNFDGHDFIADALKNGASCIIASKKPKFKISRAAVIIVKNTQTALADIGRALRVKYNIPVIAITGSAGKTTTKDMLAWILSDKFNVLFNAGTKNNHIGLPLTLCGLNKSHDLAVLELGTNHFGEIKNLSRICLPNAGIITNIGPAHLEYFKGLSGVLKEKYSLMDNLKPPCLAVLNADDEFLAKKALRPSLKPFILSFGIKNAADFTASDIRHTDRGIRFTVNGKHEFRLNTSGRNNIYNALAAIAMARALGMEYKTICRRLAGFSFPKGRLNLKIINKVKFIDDTYNSNPLSLKTALDTLDALGSYARKIFVMGDMLELGKTKEKFHCEAGFNASRICDIFITVGPLSGLAAKQAIRSGLKPINVFSCNNSLEARDILFKKIKLKGNDIVLVKGSRAMKMEEVLNVI